MSHIQHQASGNPCVVIKCGGSAVQQLSSSFYKEVVELFNLGYQSLLVHGGGKAITETLAKLSIETTFVEGLRKTNDEVIDVVEMVLTGSINKKIVRQLLQAKAKAVGISGEDGALLTIDEEREGLRHLGRVAKVKKVETALLKLLLSAGYLPVIAPLAVSMQDFCCYNVNSDDAASAIASAMQCQRLVIISDVAGIYAKDKDSGCLISDVSKREVGDMLLAGAIQEGMIAKVRAALYAIEHDVKEVLIINAEKGNLTKAVIEGKGGTKILAKANGC